MDVLLDINYTINVHVAGIYMDRFLLSGMGFGGGALELPFLLFIYDQPLFCLPLISFYLLFFSSLTLHSCIARIDWVYLKKQ